MCTEEEIKEAKNNSETTPQENADDNQYRIFNYFREHTGLFVTCVSALAAIGSFIVHFAVGRMNYAYLQYWNIAASHANDNNQNELYLIVGFLLYQLVLVVIHGLLSRTSDAFRNYNKLLTTYNQTIKSFKKRKRQVRKDLSKVSKRLKKLKPEQKQTTIVKEIEREMECCNISLKKDLEGIRELSSARRELCKWVIFQIVLAIAFSFIIGALSLIFIHETITIENSVQSLLVVTGIIVLDLMIYLLPAYLKSRCTSKQYNNEISLEQLSELASLELPDFPSQKLLRDGIKTIFSDKMLKFAVRQAIIVTIILFITMSISGTINAKQMRSFPIYSDGNATYAIVYTSGSTRYMEEALEYEGTMIIDTTKQRIITSDDISYEIMTFDNVSVIREDDIIHQNEGE